MHGSSKPNLPTKMFKIKTGFLDAKNPVFSKLFKAIYIRYTSAGPYIKVLYVE